MEFAQLAADDPRIEHAVNKYREQWGLPPTAQPAAASWAGVYSRGRLVLVVGERWASAHDLEITDCYPVPGADRAGTLAILRTLQHYRKALDQGIVNTITCAVLFKNEKFQALVEKVFDVEPIAVVYQKAAQCVLA